VNRHMRRSMRKASQQTVNPKRTPVNRALDEFQQFDDIERMMQKLENGAIEMEQGRPVMTTKGETYDVVSAMEGWLEYWAAVATKRGIPYDDEPMRIMKRRLDNGVHLTPDIIQGAKRVVAAQRALFRAIPRHEISSEAVTTQIKIAMEDCGIIAP
jgi:hypothetical protein